jgi:hypothetical protein
MLIRRLLLVLAAMVFSVLACETPGAAQQVTVVVTVIASQPPGSQPVDATTSTEGTPTVSSSGSAPSIPGTATTQVAIREHPGPGCPIIGYVEQGETVNFLERTNFEPHWYQTDKLGPDKKGWVYHEYFTVGDDSSIPRVPEQGCLYCGDGVCSPEIGEACDVCVPDCGVCPRCGDGAVNQGSEQCDGSAAVCPVAGSECNANCQCVPPKPKCGDGKINQSSEECDGSSTGCEPTWTCSTRCTCVAPPIQ